VTEQEVKLLKLFIANRGGRFHGKKFGIGWGYPRVMKTRTIDNLWCGSANT
jgi:hypothetical protein